MSYLGLTAINVPRLRVANNMKCHALYLQLKFHSATSESLDMESTKVSWYFVVTIFSGLVVSCLPDCRSSDLFFLLRGNIGAKYSIDRPKRRVCRSSSC